MRSDLVELLLAAATGSLEQVAPLQWCEDMALCVVVAANGYPGVYAKGEVIGGLEAANAADGVKVLHAGTKAGAYTRSRQSST
jgi:phosphoribosylamine--glycine ligase